MKRNNVIEQVIFLVVVLAFFAWGAYGALEFPTQAQTFPWFVALTALVITGVELLLYLLSLRNKENRDALQAATDTISARFLGILPYLIWLIAYYGAIYVIGMVSASALFVFLFLLIPGKMRWYWALLSAVLVLIFLISMEDVMSLRWPRSIVDPVEAIGLDTTIKAINQLITSLVVLAFSVIRSYLQPLFNLF